MQDYGLVIWADASRVLKGRMCCLPFKQPYKCFQGDKIAHTVSLNVYNFVLDCWAIYKPCAITRVRV